MSSLERPSTPRAASAARDGDDVEKVSESQIVAGYVAAPHASTLSVHDDSFVDAHLRRCPPGILKKVKTASNLSLAKSISEALSEVHMYSNTSELLTNISQTLWKHNIAPRRKDLNLERYDAALTFVDHHGSPPTHYPFGDVDDKPDLLAVFPVPGNPTYEWPRTKVSYSSIPYHRIESVVEVKGPDEPIARSQAAAYALQHLRARPDHPGFYCLTVRPQGFAILFMDTAGPRVSKEFSWDDDSEGATDGWLVLAHYVYSIYDPPRGHMLRDPSIWWEASSPKDPLSDALWTVTIESETFSRGKLVFGGSTTSRRTTVIECSWPESKSCVIVKDYYRHVLRRFDEAELLRHAHRDGFVPGVVRVAYAEDVMDGEEPLTVGEDEEKRVRKRFLMIDRGEELLKARTVNDLLKAVYDTLEVHRTLAMQRQILHRDMSIHNILMYPQWGKCTDSRFMDNRPPLIDDVLAGKLRHPDNYQANCLLIDFDNSARLDVPGAPNELACRVGTPMYISRAVSIGKDWTYNDAPFVPMPNLSAEARTLYDQVHGPIRYALFTERDGTIHGGIPPSEKPLEPPAKEVFVHKLEYDAESVFWTSLSALLRVKPTHDAETDYASRLLERYWDVFARHDIAPSNTGFPHDIRDGLFLDGRRAGKYIAPLLPSMEDVGRLLFEMAQQVAPSYASLEVPPPRPDHLHEALQRLILNYLVEHRDKDVVLDPENIRSTTGPAPAKPVEDSRHEGSGSGSLRKRTRAESTATGERRSKRVAASNEASLPVQAMTGFPYAFGVVR